MYKRFNSLIFAIINYKNLNVRYFPAPRVEPRWCTPESREKSLGSQNYEIQAWQNLPNHIHQRIIVRSGCIGCILLDQARPRNGRLQKVFPFWKKWKVILRRLRLNCHQVHDHLQKVQKQSHDGFDSIHDGWESQTFHKKNRILGEVPQNDQYPQLYFRSWKTVLQNKLHSRESWQNHLSQKHQRS